MSGERLQDHWSSGYSFSLDLRKPSVLLIRTTKMQISLHLQGSPFIRLVVRKPVFGVSDQVRHKLGCTIKEGLMLKISDLGSRGIVLSE